MEVWDTNQICRVCLTETGDFQTIFSSVELEDTHSTMHLSEIICSFTDVQITLGDGLPEQICMSCTEEAIKSYFFKLRCEESDKVLRKKLLELQNTLIPDNEKIRVTNNLEVKINDTNKDTFPPSDVNNFDQNFEILDCSDDISDDEELYFDKPEKIYIERVKQFECDICNKRFSREDLLLRHKIAHAMKMQDFKEIDYTEDEKESESNEENSEKDSVGIHQTLENDVEKNESKLEKCPQSVSMCILCLNEFISDDQLDKHFLEVHLKVSKDEGAEFFICILCNNKITDLNSFRNHIKNDHNSQCGFKEENLQTQLKLYQTNSSNKNTIEENIKLRNNCNKNFNDRIFDKHIHKVRNLSKKMVSRKKPHVCDICLKAFKQISNLKDHLRTHNGEKPFLCPTCGKGFNQLGNLRQHQVRHSGVKSHICGTCGSGFASKGELHAHSRKHTGVKPFVCDTCGNSFTTSSSLTKHKRIHSGEKPYECDYCNMKFSRSGILSRHRRIHTGEKPYICKYCSKAFTQSNDLNSHLRIHTGEKPYKCDQCGQSFRQSSALTTHKKTHIPHNSDRNYRKYLIPKKGDKVFVADQEQVSIIPQ